MHEHRHGLLLSVLAAARLLGAHPAQTNRIDRLQVARIRNQVNAHRAPVNGADAGRAQMVLDVAAAQSAARIDVFEAGEDFRRLAPDGMRHHVEPPAMAHAHHELFRAVADGGVQHLVQQGNQRGVAFERESLGADVERLQHLLEDVGLDQPGQNALAIDGGSAGSARPSMRCRTHSRRSGSGMCMNSAPIGPQ